MALTVLQTPPTYNFAKNPIWLELSTNINQAILSSYLVFCFSETGGPLDGDLLTINWGGNSETFTAVATLDGSSNQMPLRGAETLSEYVDALMVRFNLNYYIRKDFTLSREVFTGNECIRFTAKTKSPLVISIEDEWNPLLTHPIVLNDGSSFVSNLSAFVAVYEANDFDNALELNPTFDDYTGDVLVDLSLAKSAECQLPPVNTIPVNPLEHRYGLIENTVKEIAYDYAEKYGNPAKIQDLIAGDNIFIIPGGMSSDFLVNPLLQGDIYAAHPHDLCDDSEVPYCPKVSVDQPNWFYVFLKRNMNIQISVDLWFEDGTTATELFPVNTDELDGNNIYYFQSGYNQLLPHFGGTYTELPVRYQITLTDANDDKVEASLCYDIECDCHPWNYFLMFCNGRGGMETALFSGKTKISFQTVRETIEKYRGYDFSTSEGQFEDFNAFGETLLEFNSGWRSMDDMNYLRQLLLGEVYLVDTMFSRFLKLTIDSNSIVTKEDDELLFSFNLKARFAWKDCVINCSYT